MSTSKKAKNGYTWQTYFDYKDKYGITQPYSKSGFATKKEAENHELWVKAQINEQKYPIKKELTVNQVFELQMKNDTTLAGSTKQSRKKTYNAHIRNSPLGKAKIKLIDKDLVQAFFKKKGDYLAKNTCNTIYTAFHGAIIYGYDNGHINRMPYIKIKKTGIKRKKKITRTKKDHYHMMLDTFNDGRLILKSLRYQSIKIAIQIGYYTGLRVSEVYALKRTDINLEDRIIDVEDSVYYDAEKDQLVVKCVKTETSEDWIPIPPELYDILKDWFNQTDSYYVICDDDGMILNPQHIQSYLYRWGKKLGIPYSFHRMRHNLGTLLVENKVQPEKAQRIMRHKNHQTTVDMYTDLEKEYIKGTTDKLFS